MMGLAVLALLAVTGTHNRADIRILTHQIGDKSPEQIQAGIDLGVVAISVLVTWTKRQLKY